MARRRRRRLGQPDDFEDWELYDEIKSELDDTIERTANASAASAWGYISDGDLERLEDDGYTDPISISMFGWEIAVNGDILVDPHWYKTLRLPKSKQVQSWNEVGTDKLMAWLERNGYEETAFGGYVPSTEEEIQMDHVIFGVASELNVDPELVEQVSKHEDYGGMDDMYYASASGDTEVWAKGGR